MIQSFYLIAATGEALIEKHWRDVTPRDVIQYFLSLSSSYANKEDVPPVIEYSKHYIFSIYRNGNFLVAVVLTETSPLLAIEFLHRINDIFEEYFGDTNESSIKDNFSSIYQLLEEMMDYGYPLITEPNALKSMVKPPSVLSRVTAIATGTSNISSELPDGTISNIPWRKTGVKYSQNEIFIDIVEAIDTIIDARGAVVSSEVSGALLTNCRLSGTPDICVTFKDPEVIDDCSFHPCVRYNRFERDRVLSFVPPDGVFELMKYRVSKRSNVLASPLYVTPRVSIDPATGKGSISINVGLRPHSSLIPTKKNTGNITIEDLIIQMPLPKIFKTSELSTDYGSVLFDEANRTMKWTIGTLPIDAIQMTGSLSIGGGTGDETPQTGHVIVSWTVTNASFSGLSLSSLQIPNVEYKLFKGVRSIAKSGKYSIRTGIL